MPVRPTHSARHYSANSPPTPSTRSIASSPNIRFLFDRRAVARLPVVWVPALPTVLSAVIIVVADGIVEALGSDATFADEQSHVMSVLHLDGDQRQANLCEFHHSGLFSSERILNNIAEAVSSDLKCTKDGYSPHVPIVGATDMNQLGDTERQRLTDCLRASSPVTSSCQAIGKSGLPAKSADHCSVVCLHPQNPVDSLLNSKPRSCFNQTVNVEDRLPVMP